MAQPFLSLFYTSAFLAFEAQQVIALRMMRLAGGGAVAQREASRMVSEKLQASVQASFDAALSLASGKSGVATANTAVRGYRTAVRRNRRRLTRS